MSNWYLRNALLYRGQELWKGDVLILEGRVEGFSPSYVPKDVVEVDLAGLLLSPGFIDLHTHLRDPGQTQKETMSTAAAAAARGGFTTVTAMPNTDPPVDTGERAAALQKKAEQLPIRIGFAGAASADRKGRRPAALSELRAAGVWMVTDDGDPIPDDLIAEIMKQSSALGLVVANHLELKTGAAAGYFGDGIPAASEWNMLARDLQLVRETRCRYHVQHVSSRRSLELIAEAKEEGLPVTCEVTPHHLVLDSGKLGEPLGHFQMKPPLRSSADREALVAGLAEGVIDCIATDHAPHGREKDGPWHRGMPFGVTGLETAFPVLYSCLVQEGKISLERLLEAFTVKPADIAGLFCALEPGMPADFTVIDCASPRVVEKHGFASLGTNNPFIGWELQGWPVWTVVEGEEVFDAY